MQIEEFKRIIVPYLSAAYKGMFPSQKGLEVWFESLKNYDLRLIEDAMHQYVQKNRFKPVPADLIALLPSASPEVKFQPHFDGTVQCTRCNDSGLVVWDDENGCKIGIPCNCPAGHEKYRWGWLTKDQKYEYIKKNSYHGEDMEEDWNEFWRNK